MFHYFNSRLFGTLCKLYLYICYDRPFIFVVATMVRAGIHAFAYLIHSFITLFSFIYQKTRVMNHVTIYSITHELTPLLTQSISPISYSEDRCPFFFTFFICFPCLLLCLSLFLSVINHSFPLSFA